jgi:hypothetical protein
MAVYTLSGMGGLHKIGYVPPSSLYCVAARDMFAGRVQYFKQAKGVVHMYATTGAPSLLPAPLPAGFSQEELGRYVQEHTDRESNFARAVMLEAHLKCDITGASDNSLEVRHGVISGSLVPGCQAPHHILSHHRDALLPGRLPGGS